VQRPSGEIVTGDIGSDIASSNMPMHQRTVRFSPDLWEAMEEEEAVRLGVSVAQFVRDAALGRLMYAAGRRGDPLLDATLLEPTRPAVLEARNASDRAQSELDESAAMSAQMRQRAAALRAAAERLRAPAPVER
jgi:hypothetical protein